ncbi:MAG: glucose-6-phosphate dehydrogenase [Actinomycetota bacterium]|nr:glucose-6-phosphate dehydrogenase [Actinomycetota bacterium]
MSEPLVLVLFGARGDLARRMLFPGLYRLAAARRLPDGFAVVGTGRTAPDSDAAFRAEIREALTGDIASPDRDVVEDLLSRLSFQTSDDQDGSDLARVVRETAARLGDGARTLIYLSVPPPAMRPIIAMLGREGLAAGARLVVEKPFGTDLASARELDETIKSVTDEDHVYRIDHFLGKNAIHALMALRFANGVVESLWNREHLESVQIDVPERLGMEGRGSFYEQTGCFRDMVSTHLCQLLGVVAMEPPTALDARALRDAKSAVFESMRPLDPDRVVFGQYRGYRDEDDVAADSDVETYVALEAFVDTPRWHGVPFYLRTGKAMPADRRVVTLTFRDRAPATFGSVQANRLTLDLTDAPIAGFELNSRRPGPDPVLHRSTLTAGLTEPEHEGDALDAYERLLFDAMRGDQTFFARSDEVDRLWQVCTPVLDHPPEPQTYERCSWGPDSALRLPGQTGWRLADD